MKYKIFDKFRFGYKGEIARWMIVEIDKVANTYTFRKILPDDNTTFTTDIDKFDNYIANAKNNEINRLHGWTKLKQKPVDELLK